MFAALNHFKPCDPDRPQNFNTIPVRPLDYFSENMRKHLRQTLIAASAFARRHLFISAFIFGVLAEVIVSGSLLCLAGLIHVREPMDNLFFRALIDFHALAIFAYNCSDRNVAIACCLQVALLSIIGFIIIAFLSAKNRHDTVA